MKKRRVLVACAVLALAAAGAAILYAQSQNGYYSQTNLGSMTQPGPPGALGTGAVYRAGAYPLYRPQLAPGEGKQEVEAYCNTCHSTRYITMQPPLPPATWEGEVNKMIKTFGQPIPDDAAAKIIKYLQTHYTPETRKR
jgi:mono/diheme cytochrome c family protein